MTARRLKGVTVMKYTELLADFINTTSWTDLPDEAIQRSKWAMVDGIAVTFRSKDDLAEGDPIFETTPFDFLGHEQTHGGCAAKHRGLQVHHEFAMHVQVSRSHGNGHGAETLATGLKTHPAVQRP
jgi:hypothetical protein